MNFICMFISSRKIGKIFKDKFVEQEIENWKKKADKIENTYSKRLGTIIGPVEMMVHVQMLKGLIKMDDGASVKEFDDIAGIETDYALQLVVDEVANPDERFIEREALPIEEEFPEGSRAFFLGEFNYGRPVHITGHENGKVNGMIASFKGREPEFGKQRAKEALAIGVEALATDSGALIEESRRHDVSLPSGELRLLTSGPEPAGVGRRDVRPRHEVEAVGAGDRLDLRPAATDHPRGDGEEGEVALVVLA